MNKLLNVGLLVGAICLGFALPSEAQSVKKNALEKTNWYSSPREFQIVDDRPVIRDFREAPSDPGSIQLPPGPTGGMGSGGGGGSGAMGGGPSTLPSGGMQLGGPNQGFRNAPSGMGSLPKSGFGGTNIPARGMGPRGALPGVNQGVVGKMMNQQQNQGVGSGAPRGMGAPTSARTVGNSAPAVQSYSGGYGSGSGNAYGGSAGRTESNVRGRLLNSK